MNVSKAQERLLSLAEPEYGEFVAKGAPSEYPVMGVRLPRIQELANEILKGDYQKFLNEIKPRSREEMHLKSLVLAGKIKKDGVDKKELFSHVEKMDSWEMVDILCSRLKMVKKNREEWLELIDEMLDKTEYFARMGLVLLLDYYVEPDWVQNVFERISRLKNRDEYYVKMAIAWTLQKCYVVFPDLTYAFMMSAKLPEWIFRKAASKIQDSFRVDEEWKEKIKKAAIEARDIKAKQSTNSLL